MIAALYFSAGRLLYGLIERRDLSFTVAETAGQLVFLALAVAILRIPVLMVRGALLGSTFWLTVLLVRLLVRRHPVEAVPIDVNSQREVVPVGIIDFCWTGIMAGTLAFITFAQGSPPFSDPLPRLGLPVAYYEMLAENLRFLLGHTINGFFALGAVLAACMAILWAGEVWRRRRLEDRHSYRGSTIAATKMVFAFFWTSFGMFLWIGLPLYERLMAINAALR